MNADTIIPNHRLQIRTEEELESAFAEWRQDVYAAFHFSHDLPHPWLSVLLNGSVAYIHYFPAPDHPGFQSLNPNPAAGDHCTRFLQAGGCEADGFDLPAYSLIPAETGLAAAREFLHSTARPSCLAWSEL